MPYVKPYGVCAVSSVNATNARKELYKLIESVNESHEPIHITSCIIRSKRANDSVSKKPAFRE